MNKQYNGYLVNYTDNFNKKHITYFKTYSEVNLLEYYISPSQVQYEPTYLSNEQINQEIESFLEF